MTSTPRRSGIRLPWAHESDEESSAQDEAMSADDQAAGRGSDNAAPAAEAAAVAAAPASGDASTSDAASPLLASLVTAMREVAERERAASLLELRETVDRRISAIQARLSEEAEELRRRSELDVVGIADWVREENERIRIEAERKVEARQQQLAQQLADHEQQGEREVNSLRTRLRDYETELSGFFAQLEAINDPAAFGAAAKRMPRPPAIVQEPASTLAATLSPAAPGEAAAVEPSAPASVWTAAEAAGIDAAPVEAVNPDAMANPGDAAVTSDAAMPEDVAMPDDAAVTEAAIQAPAQRPLAPDTAAATPPDAKPSPDAEPSPEPEPAAADATANEGPPPPEATSAEVAAAGDSEHTVRLAALGIQHSDGDAEPPAPDTAGAAPDTATAASSDQNQDAERLEARLAELDATLGSDGAEAAAAPQPAPPTEAATAVIVKGLGSFGAITSFKQALERIEGVRGISLSLGPTGEFVYRATHDPSFDLGAAISNIEQGNAQVERIEDGSLRVTVSRGR